MPATYPFLIHLGILHEPALLLAAQALQGLPPDVSYDDADRPDPLNPAGTERFFANRSP